MRLAELYNFDKLRRLNFHSLDVFSAESLAQSYKTGFTLDFFSAARAGILSVNKQLTIRLNMKNIGSAKKLKT
jgi:hypothetical protein